MGDPRRLRKKFSKPSHPWNKGRIEEEKKVLSDYGLKRKNEVWKADSRLRKYFSQSKNFIASTTAQSDKESAQLLKKLVSFGVLPKEAKIEDVLNVQLRDLLERRLQTIVVRKNLARTMDQARQFIVHEHITVGDRKITSPSYLVSLEEEPLVNFSGDSPFTDEAHPEISIKKEEEKKEAKAEDAKEEAPSKEPPKKTEEKKESSEKKPEKKDAPKY